MKKLKKNILYVFKHTRFVCVSKENSDKNNKKSLFKTFQGHDNSNKTVPRLNYTEVLIKYLLLFYNTKVYMSPKERHIV